MSIRRIHSFMQKSQEEFKRYQSTKQDIYLAQAGEKLWNAFNMLIELKSKEKIRRFEKLKKNVAKLYMETKSELLLKTFRDTYDLHKFFYRGWTEDINDEENQYREAYETMIILIKSLN